MLNLWLNHYCLEPMKIWHKSLEGRFGSFPIHQQLLMVCNELNRAMNAKSDEKEYKDCIERALELLDFSIASGTWPGSYKELLRSRDQIAKAYISKPGDTNDPQKMLISLNPAAFQLMYG